MQKKKSVNSVLKKQKFIKKPNEEAVNTSKYPKHNKALEKNNTQPLSLAFDINDLSNSENTKLSKSSRSLNQKSILTEKLNKLKNEFESALQTKKKLEAEVYSAKIKANKSFSQTTDSAELNTNLQILRQKLNKTQTKYKSNLKLIEEMKQQLDEYRISQLPQSGRTNKDSNQEAQKQNDFLKKSQNPIINELNQKSNELFQKTDEFQSILEKVLDFTGMKNINEVFYEAERLERENKHIDNYLSINEPILPKLIEKRDELKKNCDELLTQRKKETENQTEMIHDMSNDFSNIQIHLSEIETQKKKDESSFSDVFFEIEQIYDILGCDFYDLSNDKINDAEMLSENEEEEEYKSRKIPTEAENNQKTENNIDITKNNEKTENNYETESNQQTENEDDETENYETESNEQDENEEDETESNEQTGNETDETENYEQNENEEDGTESNDQEGNETDETESNEQTGNETDETENYEQAENEEDETESNEQNENEEEDKPENNEQENKNDNKTENNEQESKNDNKTENNEQDRKIDDETESSKQIELNETIIKDTESSDQPENNNHSQQNTTTTTVTSPTATITEHKNDKKEEFRSHIFKINTTFMTPTVNKTQLNQQFLSPTQPTYKNQNESPRTARNSRRPRVEVVTPVTKKTGKFFSVTPHFKSQPEFEEIHSKYEENEEEEEESNEPEIRINYQNVLKALSIIESAVRRLVEKNENQIALSEENDYDSSSQKLDSSGSITQLIQNS